MENVSLKQLPQEYYDFMNMENGVMKNITYHRNIMGKTFSEANICKKEGCVYYSYNELVIKKTKNNSYYSKRKSRDGFTVDTKGKINVWYNKNVFQIPFINDVFNYFNFNWLNQKLNPFITKGIMEKMFAGKITNNSDIVKSYFKVMHINASPALFLKLLELTDNVSKSDFLREASVAKDINHMLEYQYNYASLKSENRDFSRQQILNDMVKEAQILDKKIDYNWSTVRLKEEHKAWTQEIMQYEIDSLKDVPLEHLEPFDTYTPEGFKLLKTQKEVFAEGKIMNHCVYTAYWNSIKTGSYLAYHVELNGEEATLGVNVYYDKNITDNIMFNQCYTRHNQTPSIDMTLKVKEFVKHLNEQVKRDGALDHKFYTDNLQYVETILF